MTKCRRLSRGCAVLLALLALGSFAAAQEPGAPEPREQPAESEPQPEEPAEPAPSEEQPGDEPVAEPAEEQPAAPAPQPEEPVAEPPAEPEPEPLDERPAEAEKPPTEEPVEERPAEPEPQATEPAAEPERPAVPDEALPGAGTPAAKARMPFALYLGFAVGSGSSDPIDSSIAANELDAGVNSFTLDEQLYGKGVVGWKLPHGRGDFRFIFQGFKEDEYIFQSRGVSARLPNGDNADLDSGLVPWWFIDVTGGQLNARRLPPLWDDAADAMFGDGDGFADFGACSDIGNSMTRCGEVTYDTANPDREVLGTLPDDFQNRINSYDIIYGREFGKRRYSSHWWGGLRYIEYEGQVIAAAWLNTGTGTQGGGFAEGEHFTDGGFLPFLYLSQETTGMGPVGSWEVDFNFYDRAFQLYMRGEAAFTYNSLTMDSHPYFQIIDEGVTGGAVLLEDRLIKELDKSSWQTRGEIGARLYMKNGLQFEVAVARAGYLDFVMLPNLLQPGVTNENPQTNTHDIVIDSFHVGAGFQF